jgi:hypothetical protein
MPRVARPGEIRTPVAGETENVPPTVYVSAPPPEPPELLD